MYVGHLVPGLVALALDAKLPTLAALLAGTWVDLICGAFVALGIDRVSIDRSAGPYMYMRLDFIDFDHSLAATLAWSAVLGVLFVKQGTGSAVTLALVSFLHWPLDWCVGAARSRSSARLVHNGDLALFPHSVQHFGLGLWGQLGILAWLGEGAMVVLGAGLAARIARQRRGADWTGIWPLVLGPFLLMSPWTSPTLLMPQVPAQAHRYVQGLSLAAGFGGPCALLARTLASAERRATGGKAD